MWKELRTTVNIAFSLYLEVRCPEISDFSHEIISYIAKQKGDVSRETSPLYYICYFVFEDILGMVIPSLRFAP